MTKSSRVLALALLFVLGGAGCSLLKKKESGDAGAAGAGVALADPLAAPNAGASATVTPPTTPTAANAPAANAAAAPAAAPANAANTAPAKSSLAVGSKGEVFWKGRWYAASILKAVGPDTYKIHYTGYESSWDEVVGSARMRGFGGSSAATPSASAAAARPAAGAKPAAAAADAPCPGPGLTRRCGGRCVNIQTDDRNCGSCGTVCPAGKRCDGHMFCRDAAGNL